MRIVITDPFTGGELGMIGNLDYFKNRVSEIDGRMVFRYNERHNRCNVIRVENEYFPTTEEVTGNGQFSCE